MVDERVSKDNLSKYLQQYKNKKEIKDNRKIYEIITLIFYTQLNNDVQFFISMNLPKIFEQLVEKKLSNYNDNLFIGDESNKSIVTSDKVKDESLNSINYLLKDAPKKIKQYPDFLIRDNREENEIYHVIDAKYKLEKNILNEQDIRQLLTYAILFNKEFSQNLRNQKEIKKIIIYAAKSNIDLAKIDDLKLNINPLDIYNYTNSYEENLFNSIIGFISISTFK